MPLMKRVSLLQTAVQSKYQAVRDYDKGAALKDRVDVAYKG